MQKSSTSATTGSSFFGSKGSSSKDTVKIQYNIRINRIEGLPRTSKSTVWVSWKRGKKPDNHGESKHCVAKDGTAIIDHPFTINASLLKDKKGLYQPKKIKFSITEDKEKDPKDKDKGKKTSSLLGTVEVDLSQYAESKTERSRTFPINDKSKATANLSVSFQSSLLKVNGKSLIKTEDPLQKEILAGLGKQAIQVDGSEYFLKTEPDMSDPEATDFNLTSDHDSEGEGDEEDEVASFEDDAASASSVSSLKQADSSPLHKDHAKPESTSSTAATSISTTPRVASKEPKDETPETKLRKYKKKVKTLKSDLEKTNVSVSRLTKDRDEKMEEVKRMLNDMERIRERSKSIGDNVIGEYTTKIDTLTAQVTTLQSDNKELIEQLRIQKKQNSKEMNDIATMQSQMITINSEKRKLEERIKELEGLLINEMKEDSRKQPAVVQQPDATAALKQIIAQLEQSLNAANEKNLLQQSEARKEAERAKTQHEEELAAMRAKFAEAEEGHKKALTDLAANEQSVVSQVSGLNTEIDRVRSQVNSLMQLDMDNQDKISALTEQAADATTKNDELEKVKEQLESQIKLLNQQIDELRGTGHTVDEQATIIHAMESNLMELRQVNQSLKSELQSIKDQAVEDKKDNDNLQSDVKFLENQSREYRDSVDNLQSEIKQLNDQASEYQDTIGSLQSEIQSLKDQASEHQSTIGNLQAEIQSLKEQSDSNVQQASASASTLIQSLKDQVDKEKKERTNLQEIVQSLRDQAEEDRSEAQSLNDQVERYKRTIGDHQDEAMHARQRMNELSGQLKGMKKELSDANERVVSLETELDEAKQQQEQQGSSNNNSDSDEEDIDELKERIEKYKGKIKDLKQELEEKEEELIENKIKYEDSVQSLTEQSTTITNNDDNKNNNNNNNHQNNEEMDRLNGQVQVQQATIDELNEGIRAMEVRLNNATKDSDHVKQQLQQAKTELIKYKEDNSRIELEDLQNIERSIYWPELDFDRNDAPHSGISVWQLIDSIGGVSKPDNKRILSKITNALEKSFVRSGVDCKVICYWFSTIVHLLQKLQQSALIPQSADPTISGIEIFVTIKLISIIESKLEKLLLPSIFVPDSIILESQKAASKLSPSTSKPTHSINKLLAFLDSIICFLEEGRVCSKIASQLLNQVFYFINAQITNNFLQNPHVCRATMGFKVKMGVSRLKEWCSTTNYKSISDQLDSSLEAANLFVLDKSIFVDVEAIKPIFQKLNLLQIKKLLESFEPDDLSPDPLPAQLQKVLRDGWTRTSAPTNGPLLIDVSKKLKI
ncbi:hypothetical protein SAMD00019534_025770 [Acytostelium subglobosum LB1]|uniref:hypothetical protein n=1 Tax=Acytostelium subglobosum LB1 TaxID=1410327 RepID=UPI000644C130|nr:hypothetical protein SAMD00019534_025770 [Acytostelium subglobosum LB1]GAM19402.1 hypothetical protein SAMD00019534_025770 [Acytostelium subglobosum LB1]|eukprot:XP_012757329.1 hypothetical protein SAMD00019534_025770 [Acytostelium subglobosum LB1]